MHLFYKLSEVCMTRSMPSLAKNWIEAGGTLPIYMPGPLLFGSLLLAYTVTCYLVWLRIMYRYHVRAIRRVAAKHPVTFAKKVAKNKNKSKATQNRYIHVARVTLYMREAQRRWMLDIRTTVIPACLYFIGGGIVWLTWYRVALAQNWPGTWAPVETYCHVGYQTLIWGTFIVAYTLVMLYIATGMGWTRPWRCNHLSRMLHDEAIRIHANPTDYIGGWRDQWGVLVFHFKWWYHALGGPYACVIGLFVMWLLHDALALVLFKIDWKAWSHFDENKAIFEAAFK